jgi:hypothetical protein
MSLCSVAWHKIRPAETNRLPRLGASSAAVRAAFAGRPGERSVMIDGATWIVMARNPAS